MITHAEKANLPQPRAQEAKAAISQYLHDVVDRELPLLWDTSGGPQTFTR